MVSSYTDNLRLTKQGTGDNPNTWGTVLNEQVIDLVGEAIAGVSNVTITGSSNVTLTTANGSTDQARHAVLVLTGTLGDNIELHIPAVEKSYMIRGAWTGDYTVTVKISGSSTSVAMSTGDKKIVYVDGTNIYDMNPEAESAYDTGDIVETLRSSAKSGWILLQGQTLGDTGSGADLTGDDYEDLYSFFWENISNDYCPVSSGRGVSASADWTAGKTLTIPDGRGRTGFGVDGSTWALGQTQGAETATIAKTNLPNETLSVSGSTDTTGAHVHQMDDWYEGILGGGQYRAVRPGAGPVNTLSNGDHSHSLSGAFTEAMGSGTALDILPKGLGVNWMVKL